MTPRKYQGQVVLRLTVAVATEEPSVMVTVTGTKATPATPLAVSVRLVGLPLNVPATDSNPGRLDDAIPVVEVPLPPDTSRTLLLLPSGTQAIAAGESESAVDGGEVPNELVTDTVAVWPPESVINTEPDGQGLVPRPVAMVTRTVRGSVEFRNGGVTEMFDADPTTLAVNGGLPPITPMSTAPPPQVVALGPLIETDGGSTLSVPVERPLTMTNV